MEITHNAKVVGSSPTGPIMKNTLTNIWLERRDGIEVIVLEWDADWQDWKIENMGSGRHRLTLDAPEDIIELITSVDNEG